MKQLMGSPRFLSPQVVLVPDLDPELVLAAEVIGNNGLEK